MYDKEIVLNLLENMIGATEKILYRNKDILRDILSHHYFDLNAEVVFEVTTEHIENLATVLKQILTDIA